MPLFHVKRLLITAPGQLKKPWSRYVVTGVTILLLPRKNSVSLIVLEALALGFFWQYRWVFVIMAIMNHPLLFPCGRMVKGFFNRRVS